jgi:ribonuclease BN (tRNA processing enzyme)
LEFHFIDVDRRKKYNMPHMKIRVIGCSGAELPGHNAPGFLLDNEIIFDAGSITSVLDEKEQLKIKHIFITHAHLDHIRSLPFLADNIVLGNKKKKVTIYSISQVITTIKKHLFNSAVWPDFTIIPNPDDAILNLVKLKVALPLQINGYTITPYRVNHPVPAVGYLVEDRSNKRLFYTGDTGPTPGTWKKIGNRKIDCLIIDVSFPNRMREMAITTGHLTPELLQEEIETIHPAPDCIYITHPKPQYFKTVQKELNRLKIRNLSILREGQIIRI